MAGYPAMVRRRIVELYEQDYSTGEIAALFGVCQSGVRRVCQLRPVHGDVPANEIASGHESANGAAVGSWQPRR